MNFKRGDGAGLRGGAWPAPSDCGRLSLAGATLGDLTVLRLLYAASDQSKLESVGKLGQLDTGLRVGEEDVWIARRADSGRGRGADHTESLRGDSDSRVHVLRPGHLDRFR